MSVRLVHENSDCPWNLIPAVFLKRRLVHCLKGTNASTLRHFAEEEKKMMILAVANQDMARGQQRIRTFTRGSLEHNIIRFAKGRFRYRHLALDMDKDSWRQGLLNDICQPYELRPFASRSERIRKTPTDSTLLTRPFSSTLNITVQYFNQKLMAHVPLSFRDAAH